jgi:DNA-binding LacI/PurR family transcriptional regulator
MISTKTKNANSRTQFVCDQLRELAFRRGPGFKLPTYRELCSELGTHQVTLNDALAALEAQNVIERKPGSGIYVSRHVYRKSIRVLLDSSLVRVPRPSPFWGQLWGGLMTEAERRRREKDEEVVFQLIGTMDPNDPLTEERLADLFDGGLVHGMLAIGLEHVLVHRLAQEKSAIVSFAGFAPWEVRLDFRTGCEMAVQELVERGCNMLAYWSPVSHQRIENGPPDGHKAAIFRGFVESQGLVYDAGFVKENVHLLRPHPHGVIQTEESHQQQGYRTAMEVFGDGACPRPDGIFVSDDMMADGALAAMSKLGIQAGRDVHLAVHSNVGSVMLYRYEDDLIFIDYDPAEIVAAMFAMLDELMEGGTPEQVCRLRPRVRGTERLFFFINE